MEVLQATHTPTMFAGQSQKPLLTFAQKQALIDNLQLEITERARRLRAKYALDAQSLRSRLERRIRAIPQSLRAAKIGDLVDKYDAADTAPTPAAAPIREPLKAIGPDAKAERALPSLPPPRASPSPQVRRMRNGKHGAEIVVSEDAEDAIPAQVHGTKRTSAEMSVSDKENAYTDLSLPKKRAKGAVGPLMTSKALPPPPPSSNTANMANTRATRTASRKVTSKVLSPRSHNSRALPRSPSKPLPHRPTSRPGSPLKQFTAAVSTAAATAATTTTKSKSTRAKTTITAAAATAAQQKSTRMLTGHGGGNERATTASTRTRTASTKQTTRATTTMASAPHPTGATTASSVRSRRGVNAVTAGKTIATTAARSNVRTTAATASNATVSYPRVPSAASTASSTNSAGTTIVRSRARAAATTTAAAVNSKGVVGRVADAIAGRKAAAAAAAKTAKGAGAGVVTNRGAGAGVEGRVLRARK